MTAKSKRKKEVGDMIDFFLTADEQITKKFQIVCNIVFGL